MNCYAYLLTLSILASAVYAASDSESEQDEPTETTEVLQIAQEAERRATAAIATANRVLTLLGSVDFSSQP